MFCQRMKIWKSWLSRLPALVQGHEQPHCTSLVWLHPTVHHFLLWSSMHPPQSFTEGTIESSTLHGCLHRQLAFCKLVGQQAVGPTVTDRPWCRPITPSACLKFQPLASSPHACSNGWGLPQQGSILAALIRASQDWHQKHPKTTI